MPPSRRIFQSVDCEKNATLAQGAEIRTKLCILKLTVNNSNFLQAIVFEGMNAIEIKEKQTEEDNFISDI